MMAENGVESPPFTPLGEAALESRIQADLKEISKQVRGCMGERFRALVLGGGYGRGEGGGRLGSDGIWRPYNDYDAFVIVDRLEPGLTEELAKLAKSLEKQVEVEVELWPLEEQALPHLPFTLMWCELLSGHRVLDAVPGFEMRGPALDPAKLPALEAVRYLTNRGALLLWCALENLGPAQTLKFIHKAWLASGAAVLIAEGRFCVGYSARAKELEALEEPPPVPGLLERHREAIEARLRPAIPGRDVADRLEEARSGLLGVWRWFEELRLRKKLVSWTEYSRMLGLFTDPVGQWPRDIGRHLRVLGEGGLRPWRVLLEHPRTRVSRALPALLAKEPWSADLSSLVGGGKSWSETAQRCFHLWQRAN